MTQPAKVQEPSMEEILASIRRIIADDEAKPVEASPAAAAPKESPKVEVPRAEAQKYEAPKAVPPAAKPSAMTNIPPSSIPAAKAAAAVKSAPLAMPAPAATNSQDDIDAMLAGLDAVTTEAEIRPAPPEVDVFELTDDMVMADPPAPSFRTVDPQDDVEFSEPAPPQERKREPSFGRSTYDPEPAPAAPTPQMLSHSTVSAIESAFNTLANTVLSNNARTLEDLVKEMLRPMLKSWLDDNLPGLVERIVKSEIERVSRGGR